MAEVIDSDPAPKTVIQGDLDTADASAIGGHLNDLPPGYYRSLKFIGSILAVMLMANSLYLGFVLPVRVFSSFPRLTNHSELQANTLSVINADLGLLHLFYQT